MRLLERSRHWRQLAICCASLRSFITCKRRSAGQEATPRLFSPPFALSCLSLKAAHLRLAGARPTLRVSLYSREQQHENKHRDSTGILDRKLWIPIKRAASQRNPVKVCEINYVSEAENRGNNPPPHHPNSQSPVCGARMTEL